MRRPLLSYRPELDGLRAVAVLAVLLYHLRHPDGSGPLLPGGFLGVDLFFVLSGYLITALLVGEAAARGRVDLRGFWWRRARRLLPSLLLVLACCLPVAWHLLLPAEAARFGRAAWATLGFVSNLFWAVELGGYGAPSALLQPLLHGWSLAVEAQFYLIFPPLLLLLLRAGPRGRIAALGLAALAGLAAAQALSAWHPVLGFYAPLGRGWEFLAGALVALAPPARAPGPLARFAPPLALAGLVACFALSDLGAMRHPGLSTLPAVLASAVLIGWLRPGALGAGWLAARPMLHLGRLSYALYLWHLPVFAFGRMLAPGPPGWAMMAGWLALSYALALAGDRLVDRPLRHGLAPRAMGRAGLAALLPILGLSSLMALGHGGAGRQADLAALYGPAEFDNAALARASWGPLDARAPGETIGPWNARRPSKTGRNDLWFAPEDRLRVLIVGDSLSKDLYNALRLNAGRFPGTGFARFNLHRRTLTEDLALLRAAPNFAASDMVVIAPRYYREYRAALARTLGALQGAGKRVVVMGPAPEFGFGAALPPYDAVLRRAGDRAVLAGLNARAPRFEDPAARAMEAEIRRIAARAGAGFLSRRALVCPGSGTGCTLVAPSGRKTMYDAVHWTLEGARLFGRRAAAAGWFGAPGATETAGLLTAPGRVR